MGSPCADVMNLAFEALGENVEAIRQLRQDYLEGFNRVNIARKGVKFSVLAGNPLPTMCKSVVWNDGVVPVPSAKWKIKDNAESKSLHTDLTGTSDFSAFVKPRLAIGPRGDHNPEPPDPSQYTGRLGSVREYGAAFALVGQPMSYDDKPFAKALEVAPKQAVEVEIPVNAAANLGVTFMTDPGVTVSLIDNNGNIVARNLAKSPESTGWFRSLFYDKPVAAGTWKIRIENTGDMPHRIVLTTWAGVSR